jgi:hypothetical protein
VAHPYFEFVCDLQEPTLVNLQKCATRQTGKKMTDAQQEKFHDLITHQNFDYHEMVEVAIAILNGEAY